MANLFSGLFSPSSYLGIDIGTTAIKLLELSLDGQRFRLRTYGELQNYAHLERLNNAIQTPTLKMLDESTAEMLNWLIREAKPKTRRAIMSVPLFSAFVTIMQLPLLSAKEVDQAVPFEAKQYIPIPVSEIVLDWQIISKEGDSKTEVLLIALPKDIIEKYKRIAERAKLDLKALELESLALARSLVGSDPISSVIVDIGSRVTNIAIISKGYLRQVSSIEVAGGDLSMAIARGIGVPPRRAEFFKRERGLKVFPGEEEAKNLLLPFLDSIVLEVRKQIQIFLNQNIEEPEKIIITGGSSHLPGLIEYFAEGFQGKTVIGGNPFLNVLYPKILLGEVDKMKGSFAVAVGLAMRELIK